MKTDLVVAGYLFHNNKLLLIHHKKLDKWLPVGGHIDPTEIPDDCLVREFKEEVNLDIEIIKTNNTNVPNNRKLFLPFHIEVHNAGDHDHCCLFYLCQTKNPEVKIKPDEIIDFKWFQEHELNQDIIPQDVQIIGKEAFKTFSSLKDSK